MNENIIEVELSASTVTRTRPVHQWDIGQIIKVMDAEIEDGTPVDFGNRFMKGGLRAYVIDNQVTIPAPALQQERDLTGYVVITDENSETTVKEIAIPVIARPKPEDYVDEEIRESTEFQYVLQAVGEVEADAKAAAEAAKNAADSKTAAVNAATAAGSEAAAAESAATSAAGSATEAADSKQAASDAANTAEEKANEAEAARQAAETAKAAAEAAKDKAQEIVGGDYATKTQLNSHIEDSTAHITAAERTKWNQAVTDVGNLSEEIANYLPKFVGTDKVGKIAIVGTDGYITWIDMPEGSSADVTGVVDEANNILLTGNLADGTYTLKYENDDGTYTEIGTLEVGAIVTYTITQNLTNVTSDNLVTEVRKGERLTVNLTVSDGYNLSSVVVTMGGTDITSSAVSGNVVTITSVTGDVVITAVAEKPFEPTNFFVVGGDGYLNPGRAAASNGANRTDVTTCLLSNYIEVQNGDEIYAYRACSANANVGHMALYKADKTGVGFYMRSNPSQLTNISMSDEVDIFTINYADAAYMRVCCLIPSDLSTIVINIKRNGEWL